MEASIRMRHSSLNSIAVNRLCRRNNTSFSGVRRVFVEHSPKPRAIFSLNNEYESNVRTLEQRTTYPSSKDVEDSTSCSDYAGRELDTQSESMSTSEDLCLALIPKTKKKRHLPWWTLSSVDKEMLMQVATCAAAAIAEPLLGMVDTVCIGQLGMLPLAAMAPNNTVYGMLNQLATFTLVVTVSNKIAAALGAGKVRSRTMMSAANALKIGLTCSTISGVLVAICFLTTPVFILNTFGAFPETISLAKPYFLVRAAGIPALLITMVMQGAYSAALDMKTPLLAVVGAGVLNGCLDLLFIYGFNWGLGGAALATVIAQYAACGMLVVRAFTADKHKFQLGNSSKAKSEWWKFASAPRHQYAEFIAMCMEQLTRAINVMLAWTACNLAASRLGPLLAASHQLVFQVQMFQILAMQSFATVSTAVTARAFHGGGLEAAKRVTNRLLTFSSITALTLALVTWTTRHLIPVLFTSDLAVHAAVQPAMFPVCCMLGLTWFKVPEGSLLGIGDGRYLALCYIPAALATIAQLLNSMLFNHGLSGVWFSLVAYYSCLATLFCVRWYCKELTTDPIRFFRRMV
mmetsp:Transcript_593/g.839  ORF Transcript_593/g.839 Transcript_593/m.839 type:complete len:574 (-) Transcript_593:307-2028(-)|eukprot:CAMPEP_0196579912 /NCGR_PEP_ID=MMETSP1081-20130531/25678_1 /TAXON_ID=36882 /ORGANISM="Pyramimonas amylifera, Strain CCMP720" /LENGTH=573 /DNA_ID=CAMNT_0041899631 /DNA_START=545 /DNA_END=2266 /DNA_ORIENTATION=-